MLCISYVVRSSFAECSSKRWWCCVCVVIPPRCRKEPSLLCVIQRRTAGCRCCRGDCEDVDGGTVLQRVSSGPALKDLWSSASNAPPRRPPAVTQLACCPSRSRWTMWTGQTQIFSLQAKISRVESFPAAHIVSIWKWPFSISPGVDRMLIIDWSSRGAIFYTPFKCYITETHFK